MSETVRFVVNKFDASFHVTNRDTNETIAVCERERWANAIANNFNVLVKMKGKANAT